jgi:hypothetical protein
MQALPDASFTYLISYALPMQASTDASFFRAFRAAAGFYFYASINNDVSENANNTKRRLKQGWPSEPISFVPCIIV